MNERPTLETETLLSALAVHQLFMFLVYVFSLKDLLKEMSGKFRKTKPITYSVGLFVVTPSCNISAKWLKNYCGDLLFTKPRQGIIKLYQGSVKYEGDIYTSLELVVNSVIGKKAFLKLALNLSSLDLVTFCRPVICPTDNNKSDACTML